jgi:hypothetical protein
VTKAVKRSTLALRDPADYTGVSSSVPAFVYVLPCRHEDILKVGFSRDPLLRMRTLHPRYFDFFDCERAFLIETDTVREARRLESDFASALEANNAPAPLVVSPEAGGHTEWYRGAYPTLLQMAFSLATVQGWRVHAPLRPWLAGRLDRDSGTLYEWSSQVHAAIQQARIYGKPSGELPGQLRARLDALAALGLAPQSRVPPAVWSWYVAGHHE